MLSGSQAADAPAKPAEQPADLFDFWVGDWDASWKNPGGTTSTGRNRITKILDGTVLEEHFEGNGSAKAPGLKGKSLSVLQKGTKVWKQTWADNQGGYFTLTAQTDGDKRIFITDITKRDGKELAQRMVVHSIKKDSFTWDWEGTTAGGKTWKRQWQVSYVRRSDRGAR